MGYQLGVDLGTTYTAAAVGRGGRVEACTLGSMSPVVPSVVLLRADGEVLVGEPAVRRGTAEPTRVAREFKRRLGDPTPLVLGGTPYGAESLMGHLLKAVVKTVTDREGSAPDRVVLTHPANYGPYKQDMMREVARLAGLDLDHVTFLTEPQAAAISYASRNRVDPGEIVAVYDFGGGTFDAALVQRTDDGFALIGRPEGMERFGGIDIDAALLAFVDDRLGGRLTALQPDDPAVQSAMLRLKDDCRAAKEALSGDTDTTVQVSAPGLVESVRITRDDLEGMIRPRLGETVDAVRRAVASAEIDMARVSKVLLVGGSSQIPLVAETVRTVTGRPVAIDAHPKFSICLGAAAYQLASSVLITPPLPANAAATQPITEPPRQTSPSAPATATPAAPAAPTTPNAAVPTARVTAAPSPSTPRTGLIATVGVAAAAIVGLGSFLLFKKDSPKTVEPPRTAVPQITVPATSPATTPVSAPAPTAPITSPPATPPPASSPPITSPVNRVTPADLAAALLTADDLSDGFADTAVDESGNDICGTFLAHQPIGHQSASFVKDATTPQLQQVNHTIEVYGTPADARAALADQATVVNNECNGYTETLNNETLVATAVFLDGPPALTSLLPPGCTDIRLVTLTFTGQTDPTFKILTNYVAVRCGNVVSAVSIQGLADANGENSALFSELNTNAVPPMVARAAQTPFTPD